MWKQLQGRGNNGKDFTWGSNSVLFKFLIWECWNSIGLLFAQGQKYQVKPPKAIRKATIFNRNSAWCLRMSDCLCSLVRVADPTLLLSSGTTFSALSAAGLLLRVLAGVFVSAMVQVRIKIWIADEVLTRQRRNRSLRISSLSYI